MEGSKAYLFELKRDLYANEKEMNLEQIRKLYGLAKSLDFLQEIS